MFLQVEPDRIFKDQDEDIDYQKQLERNLLKYKVERM